MSELGQERLSPVYLATSALPLKTDKRRHVGMSASCQKRAYAPQHTGSLFDHLVGGDQQPRWHRKTKRLCRFDVESRYKFGRRLYREVGRLGAAQNAVHVVRRLAKFVHPVNRI